MKQLLLSAFCLLMASPMMAQDGLTEPGVWNMSQDDGFVYLSVYDENPVYGGGTALVVLNKETGEAENLGNPLSDLVPRITPVSDVDEAARNITSVLKDGDDLWLGTLFGGLYVQHGDGTIDRVSTLKPIYSLTLMDETLWVGSSGAVTAFMNGEQVASEYSLQSGSSYDPVYTVAKDGEGTVWVGMADVLSDHTLCKIVEGEMMRGFPDFWSRVSRLVLRDGTLWAATMDDGLYRIGKDEYFAYKADNSDLPGNLILDMLKDDGDNLWLGMQDNVVKFDGESFESFPVTGLVRSMLLDGTTLYVGTDKGLFIFDTEMKSATQAPLVQVPTGICGVDKTGGVPHSRYSVDGQQLKAPVKGLNIVRMSDGTVRKVVVK